MEKKLFDIIKRGDTLRKKDDSTLYVVEGFYEGKYGAVLHRLNSDEHLQIYSGIIDKDYELVAEHDNVNHPSHYTWLKEKCGIEVIDITRHLDFDLGNAVKYILRAGHKHEEGMTDKQKRIEDLKKAIFYINDEIKMAENGD